MPAIKVKPSRYAQKRDFWGDKTEGDKLSRIVQEVYGSRFGAVKRTLAGLQLTRRLYNMYLTGERRIPDELWAVLRVKLDVIRAMDDVDPLS